jgi:hypothetical protein
LSPQSTKTTRSTIVDAFRRQTPRNRSHPTAIEGRRLGAEPSRRGQRRARFSAANSGVDFGPAISISALFGPAGAVRVIGQAICDHRDFARVVAHRPSPISLMAL